MKSGSEYFLVKSIYETFKDLKNPLKVNRIKR